MSTTPEPPTGETLDQDLAQIREALAAGRSVIANVNLGPGIVVTTDPDGRTTLTRAEDRPTPDAETEA